MHSKEIIPLVSLPAALSHLRSITWESRWLSRLRLGQQEILAQIGKPLDGEKLVNILDPRGNLVALVEWTATTAGGWWRLFRGFHWWFCSATRGGAVVDLGGRNRVV